MANAAPTSQQLSELVSRWIRTHTTQVQPSELEDKNCPICSEPYDNEQAVKISNVAGCTHIFGLECLTAWLKTPSAAKSCPLCRNHFFLGQEGAEGGDVETPATVRLSAAWLNVTENMQASETLLSLTGSAEGSSSGNSQVRISTSDIEIGSMGNRALQVAAWVRHQEVEIFLRQEEIRQRREEVLRHREEVYSEDAEFRRAMRASSQRWQDHVREWKDFDRDWKQAKLEGDPALRQQKEERILRLKQLSLEKLDILLQMDSKVSQLEAQLKERKRSLLVLEMIIWDQFSRAQEAAEHVGRVWQAVSRIMRILDE